MLANICVASSDMPAEVEVLQMRIERHESRRREIGCYNDCVALEFDRPGRDACQIVEGLKKSKPESLGFQTSGDPVVRYPTA